MKQRQICLRLVCLCHRLVDVAAPAGIWPIPRGPEHPSGVSTTMVFPQRRAIICRLSGSVPPSRQDSAMIKAHAVTKHTTEYRSGCDPGHRPEPGQGTNSG
jgi:hypothetical protein